MRIKPEKGKWGVEQVKQLCEHCAKACGGCSWSDALEPVEGWNAEPVTIPSSKLDSYVIRTCPEFVWGNRDDKRHKKFDYNGCMLLMEAMLKQMREDYQYGNTETRNLIEKFLRSDVGKKMLQLSDPDGVIKGLRAIARREISARM